MVPHPATRHSHTSNSRLFGETIDWSLRQSKTVASHLLVLDRQPESPSSDSFSACTIPPPPMTPPMSCLSLRETCGKFQSEDSVACCGLRSHHCLIVCSGRILDAEGSFGWLYCRVR